MVLFFALANNISKFFKLRKSKDSPEKPPSWFVKLVG